jgi:hypothetical protein
MLHHCAFQLDWSGHVVGRIDLSCADDEDAKTQARQFLHHCDIEVWRLAAGWPFSNSQKAVMMDTKERLHKLSSDAAECTLISEQVAAQAKQELFARLAEHLSVLASDAERKTTKLRRAADCRVQVCSSVLGFYLWALDITSERLPGFDTAVFEARKALNCGDTQWWQPHHARERGSSRPSLLKRDWSKRPASLEKQHERRYRRRTARPF